MIKLIIFALIVGLVEHKKIVYLSTKVVGVERKENTSFSNITENNTLLIANNSSHDLITSRINFEVYNQLLNGKTDNFYISPYSIINSLALCYFASENETAEQIKKFLNLNDFSGNEISDIFLKRFSKPKNSKAVLNQANKIFVDDKTLIKSELRNFFSKKFHVSIENLNIDNGDETANLINDWIKNESQSQITSIISDKYLVNLNSAVVLSANYFTGTWLNKFSIFNTNLLDFHLQNGTKKKVQMMRNFNKKFKFLNLNLAGIEAVSCEFSFSDKLHALTIIMPANESNYNIELIEANLNAEKLLKIIEFEAKPVNVIVFLPKFKITTHFDLSHHAQKLGIPLLFDKDLANLNAMSDQKNRTENLFISKFIYKSTIEINELGTGALLIPKMESAFPVSPISNVTLEFKANRPFLFIIHSKTDIISIGKYTGFE